MNSPDTVLTTKLADRAKQVTTGPTSEAEASNFSSGKTTGKKQAIAAGVAHVGDPELCSADGGLAASGPLVQRPDRVQKRHDAAADHFTAATTRGLVLRFVERWERGRLIGLVSGEYLMSQALSAFICVECSTLDQHLLVLLE